MYFDLSYGILWTAVLAASVLLKRVVDQTTALRRSYGAILIQRIPDLELRKYGSETLVSTKDMRGRVVTLIFVDLADASGINKLIPALSRMLEKFGGSVYLICRGADRASEQFIVDHFQGSEAVTILADRRRRFSSSLRVNQFPSALVFDAEGRHLQYISLLQDNH
jgi:hypothetical protein